MSTAFNSIAADLPGVMQAATLTREERIWARRDDEAREATDHAEKLKAKALRLAGTAKAEDAKNMAAMSAQYARKLRLRAGLKGQDWIQYMKKLGTKDRNIFFSDYMNGFQGI